MKVTDEIRTNLTYAKMHTEQLLNELNEQLKPIDFFSAVIRTKYGNIVFRISYHRCDSNMTENDIHVIGYITDDEHGASGPFAEINGVQYRNLQIEIKSRTGYPLQPYIKFERVVDWTKPGHGTYPSDSARKKIHAEIDDICISAFNALKPLFPQYLENLTVLQAKSTASDIFSRLQSLID